MHRYGGACTKGKEEAEARKRETYGLQCTISIAGWVGWVRHNSHVFHILHDKKWFKWKHSQRQPMQRRCEDTIQRCFVRNCVGACGRPYISNDTTKEEAEKNHPSERTVWQMEPTEFNIDCFCQRRNINKNAANWASRSSIWPIEAPFMHGRPMQRHQPHSPRASARARAYSKYTSSQQNNSR